jgi:phage FluMu protein Com
MIIERRQKDFKKIISLSDWKEYYLESKSPNCQTINLIYLHPLRNYEGCTITVSSIIRTNSIRTLVYYDYIEINDIKYLVVNEYSSLNSALFSIVLDEWLPDNIQIQLDYCNRIYFQLNEN